MTFYELKRILRDLFFLRLPSCCWKTQCCCLLHSNFHTAISFIVQLGTTFLDETINLDNKTIMWLLSSDALGLDRDAYENILHPATYSRLFHFFFYLSMRYKTIKGQKLINAHCYHHTTHKNDCANCNYKFPNLEVIVRVWFRDGGLTTEDLQQQVSYER